VLPDENQIFSHHIDRESDTFYKMSSYCKKCELAFSSS